MKYEQQNQVDNGWEVFIIPAAISGRTFDITTVSKGASPFCKLVSCRINTPYSIR